MQQREGAYISTFLVPLLSGLAWLLVGYPVLRWLWIQWFSNDYYSHGVLVFPVALFLFWRLWPRQTPWEGSDLGLIALGGTVVLYVWASGQHAEYLAAAAWIAMGAALVWGLAGLATLRRVWFPFLFALLAVPLPFVEAASLPLSQVTGTWSALIVRALGVPVIINGSQITLPNANLVVGAQCSGLRSMVSLFTLSALFAFIVSGPLWGRVILLLSALPVALVGNLARVISLLVVAYRWGPDVGFTFYHDYSGYVFFITAFGVLVLLARGVRCGDIRSDLF